MTTMTDEELKSVEIGLLDEFRTVCDKENLRYSLIGGTLLGAVRHKGFIPWDDDIDVSMPRPDYERFIEYCMNNETPFELISHKNNEKYKKMFAKISDRRTFLEDLNPDRWNCETGVYLDIFPIDGLGKTKEEAEKAFSKIRFSFETLVASQWKKFKKSKTHKWYVEPVRFFFFVISRFIEPDTLIKRIETKILSYGYEESDFVGAVSGSYRTKEIVPSSVYENYTDIQFEKNKYASIKDHETYLSSVYGDYMQLPPVEKRVSHHTFIPYWR